MKIIWRTLYVALAGFGLAFIIRSTVQLAIETARYGNHIPSEGLYLVLLFGALLFILGLTAIFKPIGEE